MFTEVIKCIWMEAEVVDYKLCQLNYDCDSCSFHRKMTDPSSKTQQPVETSSVKVPFHLKKPSFNAFKPGYQYYENYIWIKRVGKYILLIGLDDFILNLWEDVDTVLLAQIDTYLIENSCFAWIVLPQGIVYLRIPFTGRVIEQNPYLVSKDYDYSQFKGLPLSEKWIVKLDFSKQPIDRSKWLTKSQYLENLRNGWQIIQSYTKDYSPSGMNLNSEEKGLSFFLNENRILIPVDRMKQLVEVLSHSTHFFC